MNDLEMAYKALSVLEDFNQMCVWHPYLTVCLE
jgi:hypothetical protein